MIPRLRKTLFLLAVTLSLGQASFAQDLAGTSDFQEDEFVGACIAQHKDSTNWWAPDSRDVPVIEVQRWEALAKCVKWAVNVKKDPCLCHTTCSGLDVDIFTWSDARDELLKLLPDLVGSKITSCMG